MKKAFTYEDALDELLRLLRQRPLTARQVAARMGCTPPTAYARIAALGKRLREEKKDRLMKWRVVRGGVGSGATGPRCAMAYSVGERAGKREWRPDTAV